MIVPATSRRGLKLATIAGRHAWRLATEQTRLALRRPFLKRQEYHDASWRLRGQVVRAMCEELGPTFIKLAQILSTRRDMLPPPILAELERLQDDVPPFDSALVPVIFERDFGCKIEDVFSEFSATPVASASVAQVHRGVLNDGREVAVKVLRPGIAEVMKQDVAILTGFANLVAKVPHYGPRSAVGFVEYFGEMLLKQLDLRIEAENNRQFRELYADQTEIVRVPDLVPEYCSRNIMTMAFVRGLKPTDERLPMENRKQLAETGLVIFYRMILLGLLHADLHPGNILISPDGHFWIFDLGIVDTMSWDMRKHFFEAWFSSFRGEGAPFGRLMLNSSVSHEVHDFKAFEADVTAMLRHHLKGRIGEIQFGGIMMAMGDIQRKYKIVMQPAWVSVAMLLVTIEGLARHFDPDMNVEAGIAPRLKKFLRILYLMDPKLKRNRQLPKITPRETTSYLN